MIKKVIYPLVLAAAAMTADPACAVMNGLGQDIFPVQGVFQANLNMGNYAIWSSSAITAAVYQINGSTALVRLQDPTSWSFANAGTKASGSGNLFMGSEAGGAVTTGTGNILFGSWAGNNYTTGVNNIAIGLQAGNQGTTGKDNVFIGYNAGYRTNGNANVVVGWGAMGAVSGADIISSNTLVGYNAGGGLSAGGNDNIFVGFKAGYNVSQGTGNIVIGYDKGATAFNSNNQLNIGGLVYGDLSNKTLGVGRLPTQHLAALDVVSTGTAHTEFAQVWRASDGVIKASMSATGVLMADKAVANSASVGGGTTISKIMFGTVTLDPASVAAGGCNSEAVAVTGAVAGDHVVWTAPNGIEAGLVWSAYASSSADVAGLRLCNLTVGAVDPISASWGYLIVR